MAHHNRELTSCFTSIFFLQRLFRAGSGIQNLPCHHVVKLNPVFDSYLGIYYSKHNIVMSPIIQLNALSLNTYRVWIQRRQVTIPPR